MSLRILHLCQPTDGGAAVVTRDLVRAGVAAGDRVTVGCPAGGYLSDWVVSAGAEWVELPMSRAPSPRDLAIAWRVRRMLRDADVVHLHSSKAGAVGRLAASTVRRSRPRILFTPHGWSWYVGGRLAIAYRLFERWAAPLTDVITVVSEEELVASKSVLRSVKQIEVIENGVDADVFTPDGPVAPRAEAPLVVQVGRLCRQKGQDRAIRALARTVTPSARLRLVGDGPDAESLRELAVELGVLDRVEFSGSVDPRPHFRAADLVLMPSRWEGMSLVLLEAMAIGATVVSTPCGGSVDTLGDAGVVVDAVDDEELVAQLARTIDRLLSTNTERIELGQRARARVQQRFRLSETVERYVTLWHQA